MWQMIQIQIYYTTIMALALILALTLRPSLPLGSDSEPDSSDGMRSGGDDDPDTDDNSNPDTNGDPADGLEPRWAGSWQDTAQVIAAAQGRNIRHEAAEVAPSTMPPLDAEDRKSVV